MSFSFILKYVRGVYNMKYQVQENCLTIFLPGELDHHNAEEIRKESDRLIEHNHIRYVIFDFADTKFCDSSGIGVLIGRKKTMDLHSGRVQAIHLSGRALQIFEKSGLTRIIELDQQDEKKTCRQTQYFG